MSRRERERESHNKGGRGKREVVEGRREGGAGVEYRARRKIGPRKWNGRTIGKHKRVVGRRHADTQRQTRKQSRHAATQKGTRARARARRIHAHTRAHIHAHASFFEGLIRLIKPWWWSDRLNRGPDPTVRRTAESIVSLSNFTCRRHTRSSSSYPCTRKTKVETGVEESGKER